MRKRKVPEKQRATKEFVSEQLSAQRAFETQNKKNKFEKSKLSRKTRIITFLKGKPFVLGITSIIAGFAGLEFIHRIFKPDIRLLTPTEDEYRTFINDMYSLQLLDIVHGREFFQMNNVRDRLKAKYEQSREQQETL